MNKLNEEKYFNPNGEFKKYMDKVFKQAGIKVIKFDPMKQSFHNGAWGGFYTVKSSNKVDMSGQGKVKRGSAVLPVYISRVGEIELGIKAGGFHIGKAGSSQVLKNLKDFKKSDLDESVEESVNENLLKQIKQAEKIAKSMSGNMTGAVKGIEKIRRGLSHHKRVKVALKKANEGIGDMMSKKISKHKGTRNSADAKKVEKLLLKYGNTKKDVADMMKKYDYVSKTYRNAKPAKKAEILSSLRESIVEGIFGKFDTGAGFKGNGMTVYDRNQEKAGDYKDIAHIGEDGKITIYDRKVKKEPKLMQSLNKISQEFKKTFKENVDEALDPYKDFDGSPKEDYNLNLGAFVDEYQKFLKFMKKYKEVPDKNKREWALSIRKKVGQGMFNGHIHGFEDVSDLLSMGDKFRNLKEGVNESGMELNKIKDAILMFQKKIKKQGGVTNARDEDHLKNLIKLYKQMGGKGVKESVNEACWVGYKQVGMKDKNGKKVPNCVKEIYEIFYEEGGKGHGYTFEHIKDLSLTEAEYQDRKVKLGKIMQGDQKKFKVYVKNPKGNVVKVNFGQGGDAKGGTMRIRKSNPKARASFRARHNCDSPGPRHKARYWSCRKW